MAYMEQYKTSAEIDLAALDEDDVLRFVHANYSPEDVFGESEMDDWFKEEAKRRDYIPDPGE